jgi:hypothetical protein
MRTPFAPVINNGIVRAVDVLPDLIGGLRLFVAHIIVPLSGS